MSNETGANGIADLDFGSVSPQEFARIVKGLSGREITEIAADEPLRARVVAEIFGRMGRQFRSDMAGSLKALVRWKITGVTELVYETAIDHGDIKVTEGRSDAEPRTTLVMGDEAFLKLTSGNGNPVTLFVTRKLKIAGDVGFAAGLTRYFDIPKA
ncbi:SCP2 sterol-binding domain-containing protein [Streptomyces sp. NPDC051940]|uniref:SCP2 sterol-binding domain-containing protein n=1 Tax=Streptomyces sp. NPDC051940 TaxID=3155675 RepID=UPI00343D87F3